MYKTYKETLQALVKQDLSCLDLVNHYLNEIEQKSHLNAFLEVFTETASKKAKEVDQKLKAGTAGKLAGFVIGIKDVLAYKDHKVSSSSRILAGFESIFTSTVVERLLAEDAIIIGRLNCDEFAMGGSNENSSYGNVLNPIDQTKVPGGSSGGSAAAVAAGLCLGALGTDTGGSIRQPAAFCGITGLKPTYGRVSRWGLLAYASSFDQIGPMTHGIDDAGLLLEVMAGKDGKDATCNSEAFVWKQNKSESKTKTIGIPKQLIDNAGIDPEINKAYKTLITDLEKQGHNIQEFDFPYFDYLVPTYYVLTTAEASSNLARYDGAHFGYRSPNATDIESTYVQSRTEGFGPEVKRRILLGTFVLSAGYFDAYYTKAQKVRRLLKNKTEEVFNHVDFILTPTTPTTAFAIGENTQDPIAMYLQDIFTVHANLIGNPAISLPTHSHSNGMPFGFQLMGKSFAESELLNFSKKLI